MELPVTVARAPTGDPTKGFEGCEAERAVFKALLFKDRLLSCPDLMPTYPHCPLDPP